MARRKKTETTATTTENTSVQVVGTSFEEKKTEALSGSNVVTLAVALRGGLRFDDVPTSTGGTKSVTLPGLDDALRGKKGGILTPDGSAVFCTIAREDWEAIKRMHGNEVVFRGRNGHAPCVFEMTSSADAAAYADEISETSTGAAPLDPAKMGLKEADRA